MINFFIKFILISALVCWIIFWLRIIGLEKELNTYYYIPSTENAYIQIYIKNYLYTILILLMPIANIIFTINSFLEDHIALLEDIANDVGAVPIEDDKEGEKY